MKVKMIYFAILLNSTAFSQENQKANLADTIILLNEVIISHIEHSPERLPETKDNVIYSGKKNEVIKLAGINANLTTNNAREVFSRIPGVTIWENEGSGIQINVGVRAQIEVGN